MNLYLSSFLSYSAHFSLQYFRRVSRLENTTPYVCSAGCWAANPLWHGWVEIPILLFQTFPEHTELYVFSLLAAAPGNVPNACSCVYILLILFILHVWNEDKVMTYLALILWVLNNKQNLNPCNLTVHILDFSFSHCAPLLFSQDRSRGLCPRNQASSWIHTTSGPWSGAAE